MKIFLILLFLIVPSVSWGQFNSVTYQNIHLELLTDNDAEKILDVCIEEDTIPEDNGMDSIRHQLYQQYLSVSLPLDHINISSSYGERKNPFNHKQREVHNGLDLSARYETVYSMFSGIVKHTGYDTKSGKHITIQYGDYLISYCHLSKIQVRKGTHIDAGEAIGVSGNSGRSTGPHLHLTCKRDGQTIDPEIVLNYISEIRSSVIQQLAMLED